ncbi:MAG: DUF45 domain-containing protein [Atopobiaceae bacterium]|nr:DUF45 domain-containing protein [Atopobiaceae bacterium]
MEQDARKTYSSTDEIPDDSEGRIDTINFDGVTAQVKRIEANEVYFSLAPPDAAPTVHVNKELSNQQVIDFVTRRLGDVRQMRNEMIKRNAKGPQKTCRYQTGDVAYVLGRPFMIRVYPIRQGKGMKKASRGRANTSVRIDSELGLIELYVLQTGNFDQRRLTFLSWANQILARNASKLCTQALARAGIADVPTFDYRVITMHDGLVRIDMANNIVWLSETLVAWPPSCTVYAFMREYARHSIVDDDEAGNVEQRRRELIEAGYANWEEAKALLEDKQAVYRRQ